jgi:hypothetical protein
MNLFRHKFIIQTVFAVAFGTAIFVVAHWGIVAVATVYAGLQLLRSLGLHWLSARSLKCNIWLLIETWLPGLVSSALVAATLYFVQARLASLSYVEPAFRMIILILLAGIETLVLYRLLYKDSVYEPWMLLVRRQERLATPTVLIGRE